MCLVAELCVVLNFGKLQSYCLCVWWLSSALFSIFLVSFNSIACFFCPVCVVQLSLFFVCFEKYQCVWFSFFFDKKFITNIIISCCTLFFFDMYDGLAPFFFDKTFLC